MATKDFFTDEARKRVGEAVEVIEKESDVEVVVSVKKRAGHYRRTDLYVGAFVAYAFLFYILFVPQEFDTQWIPVDVVIAFLFGAALSAEVSPLRRALTPRALLDDAAELAARSAFYSLGVSRTTGRTGILVFVSVFERRVLLVPDLAVKPADMGDEWAAAERALEASVAHGADFELFLTALASLKAPLTRALPAKGGQHKNQLANEPVMA
jgi:putative membrane protein